MDPIQEQRARNALKGLNGFDGKPVPQTVRVDQPTSFKVRVAVPDAGFVETDNRFLFDKSQIGTGAVVDHVTIPTAADYEALIRYLIANPCAVVNTKVSASSEALLNGFSIKPRRKTPFGANSSNEISCSDYKTAGDFNANVVNLPVSYLLDGFSSLILIAANGTGAAKNFDLTFFLGSRNERIDDVPLDAPLQIGKTSFGDR